MSRADSEQAEAPLTGNGMVGGGFQIPYYVPSSEKEAKSRIKQQACGQYIPQPVPAALNSMGGCVKRTESLYINPVIRQQKQQPPPIPPKAPPSGVTLRRKKSLPEEKPLPANTPIMPREHASYLSSAQREAVRRSHEERERYRANPFLYLTDPAVIAWLSAYCIPFIAVVFNVSLILTLFIFLSS